ncbi:MAG: beta-Ala-His dipeptidase [Candidatus Thorarchaeota archaeon]|jgi:dipeptidase D
MVFENLEPNLVWSIFEKVFTQTPRESKKEDKIRLAIRNWVNEKSEAQSLDVTIDEDEAGNLLIKKPATKGMESCQPLMLQGHMDMVCETDRKDGFDFDNDPIPIRIQDNGEWVDADGTTLGGDNGIGVSLALGLLFDRAVSHGPLEVLVTVDEETGLVGAFALEPEELGIKSRLMINIDSEDIGVITIGSAGGGDMILEKEIPLLDPKSELDFLELQITGLFGGHSGVDIHLPRASANKLAARFLSAIDAEMDIFLCSWNGGSKHNAITRESTIKFAVPSDKRERGYAILEQVRKDVLNYYRSEVKNADILEPNLSIEWSSVSPDKHFSTDESSTIISTGYIIPHGPIRFSPQVEGLVETSNNFAIAKTEGGKIVFQISARGNIDSELEAFRMSIANLASLGGWSVIMKPSYPGWAPDPKSPFLSFVKKHYEQSFGSEIIVEAIHAGLECGIVGAKIPGIQMVSIGPSLKNPHTPDEKLKIADVGTLYELLKSLVKELPSL